MLNTGVTEHLLTDLIDQMLHLEQGEELWANWYSIALDEVTRRPLKYQGHTVHFGDSVLTKQHEMCNVHLLPSYNEKGYLKCACKML